MEIHLNNRYNNKESYRGYGDPLRLCTTIAESRDTCTSHEATCRIPYNAGRSFQAWMPVVILRDI